MSKNKLICVGPAKTRSYVDKNGFVRYHQYATYRCECGTVKEVRKSNVEKGKTKSCGCLRVEAGHQNWRKNLGYYKGKGGWKKEYRHKPSPLKGKIRIEEPPGSGNIKYVSEKELEDMFWFGEKKNIPITSP